MLRVLLHRNKAYADPKAFIVRSLFRVHTALRVWRWWRIEFGPSACVDTDGYSNAGESFEYFDTFGLAAVIAHDHYAERTARHRFAVVVIARPGDPVRQER